MFLKLKLLLTIIWRVRRGMLFIEEHYPHSFQHICIKKIQLSSATNCPLSQSSGLPFYKATEKHFKDLSIDDFYDIVRDLGFWYITDIEKHLLNLQWKRTLRKRCLTDTSNQT